MIEPYIPMTTSEEYLWSQQEAQMMKSMLDRLRGHPDAVKGRVPDITDRMDLDTGASMLIPPCPCCGEGRAFCALVKREPQLVVPADFTRWCRPCRERLAHKMDSKL